MGSKFGLLKVWSKGSFFAILTPALALRQTTTKCTFHTSDIGWVPIFSPRILLPLADGESAFDVARRAQSRCFWVTGRKGMTFAEAAREIVAEAREAVRNQLGADGADISWGGGGGSTGGRQAGRRAPQRRNSATKSGGTNG